MKKIRVGILILMLSFIYSGCINKTINNKDNPQSTLAVKETNDLVVNWAKNAVFYEVFVRSFYDGNGDGIGDFEGLKDKISYFKELGVNALWLMPITKSPSYHGYNTTDYYATEPDYGTLTEFQDFLKEAHKNGIKVIMDLVANHTSTDNKWFLESQKTESNKYTDYYVWATQSDNLNEAGPWGQRVWYPLNNKYYYAIFGSGMPDLNYRSKDVKEEMENVAKFWLDPNKDGDLSDGVDGFRLDAAMHIDKDMNVTHNWWREFNRAAKAINPNAFIVGENWTDTTDIAPFYKDMDSSFNFPMYNRLMTFANGKYVDIVGELKNMRATYKKANSNFTDSIFLTNHDMDRVASDLENNIGKEKLAAAALLTLPGTPFIYYGEELGQLGKKPDDNIREPFDWYTLASGTGMTTMSKGGFYNSMKYTKSNDGISYEEEKDDSGSLLNWYKRLIKIRKENSSFVTGDYNVVYLGSTVYSYTIEDANAGYKLLVVDNKMDTAQELEVINNTAELISTEDLVVGDKLKINGYGTLIFKYKDSLPVKILDKSGMPKIRLHYNRKNGDYDGWGLHLWGGAILNKTEWAAPKMSDGSDDFGIYFDILIADKSKVLNYIPHKDNEKDVITDRVFPDLEKYNEFWIYEGDKKTYISNNESDINSIEIIPNAEQIMDNGKTMSFNADAKDTNGEYVYTKNISFEVKNVDGAGTIDANGKFTASKIGNVKIRAKLGDKYSNYIDIKIIDPEAKTITYNNVVYNGKGEVTDASSPINYVSDDTLGSIIINEPKEKGFKADGFFKIKGSSTYKDDYQFVRIQLIKGEYSLKDYTNSDDFFNAVSDATEQTEYWTKGNFEKNIWLRFGKGEYTLFVYETQLTNNNLNYKGDIGRDSGIGYYYWEPVYEFHIENTKDEEGKFYYPSDPLESDSLIIKNKALELTNGLTKSRDKIKVINDFVVNTLTYDDDSLKDGERKKQDAITCLNTGLAVCEGYTSLFDALLRASGIKAKAIGGNGIGNDGSKGGHAWSEVYVKEEDKWYFVDTTWDDYNDIKSYDYYMLAETPSDHEKLEERIYRNNIRKMGEYSRYNYLNMTY